MMHRTHGTGRLTQDRKIWRWKARTWQLRTGVLGALAIAILLTSPMMALAGTASDQFIVEDSPGRTATQVEPFAVIKLKNGDAISFIAFPGERGRTAGVLVTEQRSPTRISARSAEGLRDANPLEFYHALAQPNTRVPAILTDLYGKTSSLGQQGWARDLALTTEPASWPCEGESDWATHVNDNADVFNHDDPFSSTWDGPNTKPQHWSSMGDALGDGKTYYQLNGQANDVTHFYGSVLYCKEDQENASTFDSGQYVGNFIQFKARPAGHYEWTHYGHATQIDFVGEEIEYTWWQTFEQQADVHLRLVMAKPADQFHIGATWTYDGPTDLKPTP